MLEARREEQSEEQEGVRAEGESAGQVPTRYRLVTSLSIFM